MTEKLNISVSPHIHGKRNTQNIMLDVIIALLPATVAGIIIFGTRALAVVGICVASAVLSEYLFNLIAKKEQTVTDLSAIVTGLLLALNIPANTPLWQAAIGSAFAIIVVKCVFGGIGQNFANPAITARIFMLVAFGNMARAAFPIGLDATSGATPLPELLEKGETLPLLDLFLGKCGGAIGETCTLALIIGAIYLLVRRVITWHTPVVYIGAVFLLSLIFEGGDITAATAWILSGGLFLGAIFMATDYSTSPINPLGKVIFSIGAALITVLIRFWGNYPEGVSFAILLMNILTPFIDKWTKKRPFGAERGAKK